MDIVERLRQRISSTGMKIPAISSATRIPTERMRKWLKGIGHPKAEDTKKLEAFLKGDKVPEIVPRETYKIDPYLPGECRVTIQDHLDEIKNTNLFLKNLVNTALVDIGTNLSELLKKTEAAKSTQDLKTIPKDADENLRVPNRKEKSPSSLKKQGRKAL